MFDFHLTSVAQPLPHWYPPRSHLRARNDDAGLIAFLFPPEAIFCPMLVQDPPPHASRFRPARVDLRNDTPLPGLPGLDPAFPDRWTPTAIQGPRLQAYRPFRPDSLTVTIDFPLRDSAAIPEWYADWVTPPAKAFRPARVELARNDVVINVAASTDDTTLSATWNKQPIEGPRSQVWRPFRPEALTVSVVAPIPDASEMLMWQVGWQRPQPRPARPDPQIVADPGLQPPPLTSFGAEQPQVPLRRGPARPDSPTVANLAPIQDDQLQGWNAPPATPPRPTGRRPELVAELPAAAPLIDYVSWTGVFPQSPSIPPRRTRADAQAEARVDLPAVVLTVDAAQAWHVPAVSRPVQARALPPQAPETRDVAPPADFGLAVWDVPAQLPRFRRREDAPAATEMVSAPPIYASGVTIIVAGPYYVTAGQVFYAGALAGDAVPIVR